MTRKRNARIACLGAAVAAAGLAALTAASLAGADVNPVPAVAYKLEASLTAGQVVPAPAVAAPAAATGQFTGMLIRTSADPGTPRGTPGRRGPAPFVWRLMWRLTYSGLSSPATSAQIHTGAQDVVGPHVAGLCSPCGAATRGSTTLTASQARVLLKGNSYVQLATVNNPNGEVRGQVHKVKTLTISRTQSVPPATTAATGRNRK
jgi:hypothetical protein